MPESYPIVAQSCPTDGIHVSPGWKQPIYFQPRRVLTSGSSHCRTCARRFRAWQTLAFLVVVLLLAFLLPACGGDQESDRQESRERVTDREQLDAGATEEAEPEPTRQGRWEQRVPRNGDSAG